MTVDLIIALNGANDASYVSALIFHHFMGGQECYVKVSVETRKKGDVLHVLRQANTGEYPEETIVFNLGKHTSHQLNGRPKLLWEFINKNISEYYKNYFSNQSA